MKNFGFAFNDVNFSDRTLFIQLIPDSEDPIYNEPRRRRVDSIKIKTIHITTVLLAAQSPFFFKLISNGMAESYQRHVTLQIAESEEAAFMDMLKFMYTNTLSSTTPSALLDVLIAADKYEVESCINYCVQLLHTHPMTIESAYSYLNLPWTILMADTIKSLIEDAKEFLVSRFNNISGFNNISNVQKEEDMLSLPLAAIEAVLSRDDLQVLSEDWIYDFVMKWARRHYTNVGERQEILNTHLLRLIRFQFMSCSKLKELLKSPDIFELAFDALSFQNPLHQQLPQASQKERAYEIRPLKVIRHYSPHEECIVYLDLKHEDCVRLYPSYGFVSQSFYLSGQVFHLSGRCLVIEPRARHVFALLLTKETPSLLSVEYEFSWREKPSEEFVVQLKEGHFDEQKEYRALFCAPWDTFIAENRPHFINGMLHLIAVLKIKKQQKLF